MKIQLSQINLFSAILAEVAKQAKAQKMKDFPANDRQMNAAVEAANLVVAAFAIDRPNAAGIGLVAWLASDDTGMSSKAMAHHLFGIAGKDRHRCHPLDPSDFGRCHRFLQAVPEAQDKLHIMANVSDVWAKLVAIWPDLTALYLEELPTGTCPKLFAKMKELGC